MNVAGRFGDKDLKEPLLENVRLDPHTYYFLYVGEIKAVGLNNFMRRPLERMYGRPVDFITIVPDVLTRYPDGNLIVINSKALETFNRTGKQCNIRIPAGIFAEEVSENPVVINLIDMILDRQSEVFVNVFEARNELSLTDDDRVRLIGPAPDLASTFNNKLIQYEMIKALAIPVLSGKGCGSLDEAVTVAETYFKAGDRVFVSGAYSAAGSNSIIANTSREIRDRFPEQEGKLLVTRFVEHVHDPTVLGIVAGEGDVYIASVADQKVEETQFKGSTYPTVLDIETVRDLVEMTRTIGKHLGGQGYRGTFGCDYIVDHDGNIFFIEINARKQGTTLETTLTMIHHLPAHPYFPELEFHAVTEGRFPDRSREMDPAKSRICWGTFNYKTDRDIVVNRDVEPMIPEPELFSCAVNGKLLRERYIIEDHVGGGVTIKAGGFLGRVIAASDNLPDVHSSLKRGIERVSDTMEEPPT